MKWSGDPCLLAVSQGPNPLRFTDSELGRQRAFTLCRPFPFWGQFAIRTPEPDRPFGELRVESAPVAEEPRESLMLSGD